MALETRGSGKNLYYYKKTRINGRVVSSYCGSGQLARALYRLDQSEAARLEEDKLAGQEELKRLAAPLEELERALDAPLEELERALDAPLEELERALDAPESLLKLLVDANLIAGGYHRHNRQWRKRRSEERTKEKERTNSNDNRN
jgi:hypothetical protein